MRISFIVVVVAASLFICSSAYGIDPDINSRLAPGADGQSVSLSTSVRIPGGHSSSQTPGSNNARRVGPLVWSAQQSTIGIEDSRGVITYSPIVACDPDVFVPQNDAQLNSVPLYGEGTVYVGTLANRATGAEISTYLYCKGPAVPVTRVPAGIPVPPTFANIWQAVYSDAFDDASTSSGAYVAPAAPGLTGLPTLVWAQFPNGQSITRDVDLPNGYHINATATIDEVSIMTTTPNGVQKTLAVLTPNATGIIDGGSFENPSATHIFRITGTHIITTAIIWNADLATLTGPGIGAIIVPIGSVRLELNRNYPVQELRPGLTQ